MLHLIKTKPRWYWLIGLVLRFINPCRQFNINLSQNSFVCTQLNGFKYCYVTLTIWFNISHLFAQLNSQTVLLDPLIGPYQVLPLQLRVDQGVMAMKGYSPFPKALGLEPHHQDTHWSKKIITNMVLSDWRKRHHQLNMIFWLAWTLVIWMAEELNTNKKTFKGRLNLI